MWLWRKPRRRVWLYAFAKGFMLLDDPRAEAVPVRWSQVIEVSEVWTDAYDPSAEEYQPRLTAYSLRCADGQAHELSRYLQNVQDPYFPVGQFLKTSCPPRPDRPCRRSPRSTRSSPRTRGGKIRARDLCHSRGVRCHLPALS
jgi:hypothetical protein